MLQRARLGMAMFLLNEAVFFLFLIIGFVYFSKSGLDVTLGAGGLYTVCLAASSITMWRATMSACRDSPIAVRGWIAATILLGAAFLVGQDGRNHYPQLNRNWESAIFTLVGIHGLHVLVGVLLLGGLLLSRAGEVKSVAVQTIALYWYFVTAVWIAIVTVGFIV